MAGFSAILVSWSPWGFSARIEESFLIVPRSGPFVWLLPAMAGTWDLSNLGPLKYLGVL